MRRTPRTAAIYARISEEDKNVPKVEIQIAACRALAINEGFEVIEPPFRDDGKAATTKGLRDGTRDKRTEFDKLIRATERGDFDVIVAVAGDRLSRNYSDGMDLVEACKDGGVLLLLDDDGLIDPNRDEKRAMDLFVGGRQEIRARSAKQRRRYEAETRNALPLWGQRPFGFSGVAVDNGKGGKSTRWTLHEPAEAEAIRQAVKFFLSTEKALYEIAKRWNAAKFLTGRGGPWTYQAVRSVLKNPRNAGLLVRQGVVTGPGAWEPIVSREDWQAVQDKLSDPKRRDNPGRKPHSLGTGIVRCHCGLPMRSTTISYRYKGETTKAPGLRCEPGRHAGMGAKPVERHSSIYDALVTPLLIKGVVDAFTFGPSDLLPGTSEDLRPIEAELAQLRKARGDLLGLVAEGLADMADVSGKLRTIKLRGDELEGQRQELVSRNAQAAMLVDLRADLWTSGKVSFDDVVEVKKALRDRFEKLPLAQQRELVRTLLDVEVYPGKSDRIVITHKVVTSLN